MSEIILRGTVPLWRTCPIFVVGVI
jgi:hypothetical protein